MISREELLTKMLKVQRVSNNVFNVNGEDSYIMTKELFVNIVDYLTQSPTEEEVCKALSEWYAKEYKVDNIVKYNGSFSIETLRGGSEDLVYYDKHSNTVECCLPPYLITMIGKFYEGSESE